MPNISTPTLSTHTRNRCTFATLQHTATHCNTLQHVCHIATHCNTMLLPHCNTLQHTILATLQHTDTHYVCHTATHCNTLRLPSCNMLQHYICHAATHSYTLFFPHCNMLQHTATPVTNLPHCNILRHTAFATLQHTATHYICHTASHCNTLRSAHCNTLQHTTFLTLQHIATHCSTLQHTATHYVCHTGNYSLSHLQWHFGKLFPTLEAKTRMSLLPRFSEKRPTSFEIRALKQLSKILLQMGHSITLHHTAAHCNTLQHTETAFTNAISNGMACTTPAMFRERTCWFFASACEVLIVCKCMFSTCRRLHKKKNGKFTTPVTTTPRIFNEPQKRIWKSFWFLPKICTQKIQFYNVALPSPKT